MTVKRASDVKDSISKFLDSAQNEDLIFGVSTSPTTKKNNGFSSSIHGTPTGERKPGLSTKSDHISKAFGSSPMNESFSKRELPFDRRTSLRKSPSHVKPKVRRKGPKRRPGSSKQIPAEDFDDDDDDDDLQSFAVDNDDDDENISLSSEERGPRGRASPRTSHQSFSVRSSSRPPPPSRTLSANSRLDSLTSSSRLPPKRTQSLKGSHLRRHQSVSGLASGLGSLDQYARTSRLKQRYRSSSNRSRDDDDGDSVTSGVSTISTRSRRNSGLEGGALNAFLGDETIARNASRGKGLYSGATVATSSADEKFLRDRQARQELIMDAAMKERWQHEEHTREEEATAGRMSNAGRGDFSDDSSDEDGLKFGKKKGIMGNLKRAVRKSAQITKSGAKGTVNVVKDPKRAAKKVGGFAKDFGKETTKMVLDPSLAAKRTAKGVKGTVKLTTKMTNTVAKGSYDVTKSIAKTGVKGTSKVVGKTINGATGLFVKKDGELHGNEHAEYDPSALANRRRRDSLLDRFVEGKSIRTEEVESHRSSRIPIRTPDILAPTVNTGGGGSWDV